MKPKEKLKHQQISCVKWSVFMHFENGMDILCNSRYCSILRSLRYRSCRNMIWFYSLVFVSVSRRQFRSIWLSCCLALEMRRKWRYEVLLFTLCCCRCDISLTRHWINLGNHRRDASLNRTKIEHIEECRPKNHWNITRILNTCKCFFLSLRYNLLPSIGYSIHYSNEIYFLHMHIYLLSRFSSSALQQTEHLPGYLLYSFDLFFYSARLPSFC